MTTTQNRYPFQTKATIAARIADDFDYACAAIVKLFEKQTEYEQETSTTLVRNKAGFMSSHAVHGSRIARVLKLGETLSDEDRARVENIAPRYTKQLARFAREDALAENPALAAEAAIFGL